MIISHSARWDSLSLPLPHSLQEAEASSHVLILTLLCSILNDAFLSLGVRAGCCDTFQMRCQGRLCSPSFASHVACALGGAVAYSMKALVSSFTESLQSGVAVITSLKVTPMGCGYVFSAMPITPFQWRNGLALA